MELQWNCSPCQYLQRQIWEVQNQEQTQEVRLNDAMPDIGRILCAWGQPVLQSKEWRKDGIAVSGGVMVWVLYAPEEGSEPECMEVWLPFQGRWSLPHSETEGVIRTDVCLRSVDARMLSGRKMMIRVSVGMLAEALEPTRQELYTPETLPDGLQVLRKTYPAVLPKEAGEKLVNLEEQVDLPGGTPRKILCCRVCPKMQEQNVVGSRAVFRGCCRVHLVYLNSEGRVCGYDTELPLAQYADLNSDYDKDATIGTMAAVSSVEPELGNEGVFLKCGLIVQYVVHDRQLVTVAEDLYSPWQSVTPVVQELRLPMVLEQREQTLELSAPVVMEAAKVVDACFMPDQPVLFREDGMLQGRMGGTWQMLYYDMEGNLNAATENYMGQWELPAGEDVESFVFVESVDPDVTLRLESVAGQKLKMLTGAQLGDRREPDPGRPSLILRRCGDKSLWELAKLCGSTVEGIMKTNQLTVEPEPGQILLIPVC